MYPREPLAGIGMGRKGLLKGGKEGCRLVGRKFNESRTVLEIDITGVAKNQTRRWVLGKRRLQSPTNNQTRDWGKRSKNHVALPEEGPGGVQAGQAKSPID